jgi:AcrR family transcriptional regulator
VPILQNAVASLSMSPVDAPTSRRERKKNATRESIHETALTLTEELGLTGVTVEAITERADVSPRTFFNYFPSKVHAVLGRDPGRTARVEQALESRPHDEGEETERAMVAVIAARAAIMGWCERDGEEPLECYVQEAFDHLANGLIVSPTRRRPL